MYWGYSPAIDLQQELISDEDDCVNILIVGSSDARHVMKTVSSLYLHKPGRKITFHVVENTLDEIARSILLLSTCFEENLVYYTSKYEWIFKGLQESTRYYLEILGNSRLRPATARYLISRSKVLIDVVTDSKQCNWLNLKELKYKHRDALEHLYKFWALGASENIATSKVWDLRVRHSLGTRYDYKQGAFDWDYHMVLRPRNVDCLNAHDYVFWREHGIAFVWIEGEPIRGNPTFVTLTEHYHPMYLGDNKNGPFFTWITDSKTKDGITRIADVAEKHVMSTIYAIHKKERMDDALFAAHRDESLLNGTIAIQLDDQSSEQESWSKSNDKAKEKKVDIKWIDLPEVEVIFYHMDSLRKMKEKQERQFHLIWLAQKVPKKYRDLYGLLQEGGVWLTETRRFLVDYKDEQVSQFTDELKNEAEQRGLKEIENENINRAVLTFQK